MTFLQPFILFGLPLILLPVLIHFLNRLRHRPQHWAAIQFLLAASRSSVHQAKLKQFIILLFRTLAVLTLVLFLARPLVGGYLGWAVSTAPEAIILLIDRSASMGNQSNSGRGSKLESMLISMSNAASSFEETSHLIMIDSATQQPQPLTKAASLISHPLCLPTDAAADMPSMLQSALTWLVENQVSSTEIWIGSDLQKSTWQADETRWNSLMQKFHALPQPPVFRIFAMENSSQKDTALSLVDRAHRLRSKTREMIFLLDIDQSQIQNERFSIEFLLDGVSSEIEISSKGARQRWRHRVPIERSDASGWGAFTLSADANLHNNSVYFAYGQLRKLSASVISNDAIVGPILQICASDFQSNPPVFADLNSEWKARSEDWEDQCLIIWQDQIPAGKNAKALESFAREGGIVLFLPAAKQGENAFQGLRWGGAEEGNPFVIGHWEHVSGPLSDTDEGQSLPMHQLEIYKRQAIIGRSSSSASYEDASPFLSRKSLGQGSIYFLNTLPRPDWSNLSEGSILVPLIQRLLQDGGGRQEKITFATAGEIDPEFQKKDWTKMAGNEMGDLRWNAGVYRSEDQWLAINRPSKEDEPDRFEDIEAEALFGDISVVFQGKSKENEAGQGEAWRLFLFGMLAFLIAESLLLLPKSKSMTANSA